MRVWGYAALFALHRARDADTAPQHAQARKPYTITKQRERWTEEEHQRFLDALKLHGRAWRKIEGARPRSVPRAPFAARVGPWGHTLRAGGGGLRGGPRQQAGKCARLAAASG